ncbi:MAG: peptide deformylase [Candidatus Pacebacteria bacterium]|nr:peptide deformylase [Candidatus Paceibacterota bacterium]
MKDFEIRKFNDPVLRKKTEEIKHFNRELEWLVLAMKEKMAEEEGVGLAAPQVGISKQLIVFIDIESGQIKELINPKIIKYGKEKTIEEEGCLSFPDIFLKIKRSDYIKIKGFNLKGEELEIEATGILSRILQHETDHLYGILFFDRLPFFSRLKFKLKNRGFNKYFN